MDEFLEKAGVYIGIEATSLQDGRVTAISQSPALSDVIEVCKDRKRCEKAGEGDSNFQI